MRKIKRILAVFVSTVIVISSFSILTYASDITLSATATSSVSNGTYCLVNVEFVKHAQIDDNEATSTDGAILELWEYDGGTDQQWQIELLSNGYYKIISAASSKAITAPSSTNDSLQQKTYTGATTQQWSITDAGNGTYKLSPRSNSSYYMAAGTGIFTSDGRNVEMREAQGEEKDEWYLANVSGSDAMLLGITDDGHDHSSALGYIMPDLLQLGYADFNSTITGNISMATVRNNMANARIYVSRSHGNTDTLGSYILLANDGTSWIHTTHIYDFSTNTAQVDLSACDVMLFIACLTGANDDISLPHAAVEAGAASAVGSKESIGCSTANNWTQYFFDYYTQDYSVYLSAYYAARDCNNSNGIDSFRVVS